MLDYQQRIVNRLRGYVADLERALDAEDWRAAGEANLGIWVAQDELTRTMPHGMKVTEWPFF